MKQKCLAGAALAAVFTASSARAEPADSGWYGAIDAGGHQQQAMETVSQFNELGGPPADLRIWTTGTAVGFARIGYKISPHFRIELEVGYRPTAGYESNILERDYAGRPYGSVSEVALTRFLAANQSPLRREALLGGPAPEPTERRERGPVSQARFARSLAQSS